MSCMQLHSTIHTETRSSLDLLIRHARSPLTTLYALHDDGTLTLQVWDARNGELIYTLRGHATEIVCLSFNPQVKHNLCSSSHPSHIIWQSTIIATGSMDSTAKLWDVESGEELCTLLVISDQESLACIWHAETTTNDFLFQQMILHSAESHGRDC